MSQFHSRFQHRVAHALLNETQTSNIQHRTSNIEGTDVQVFHSMLDVGCSVFGVELGRTSAHRPRSGGPLACRRAGRPARRNQRSKDQTRCCWPSALEKANVHSGRRDARPLRQAGRPTLQIGGSARMRATLPKVFRRNNRLDKRVTRSSRDVTEHLAIDLNEKTIWPKWSQRK